MSGVEIRPTSLRVTFTYEGKQHHKTLKQNGVVMKPSQANIKYANRLAAEIRAKIKAGIFSMAETFPEDSPTVGRLGNELTVAAQLDTYMGASRIADSTRKGYTAACNFWKNAPFSDGTKFGPKQLRAVRTSQILTVIAASKVSGKTINNYTSVLRDAFNLAVKDKVLAENPVDGVEASAHQKEPPDPFSLGEAEMIIASFKKHEAEPVYNMTEFRFFTGMRPGELAGLSWSNVDLVAGTVVIKETITNNVAKDESKTYRARTLRLNSRAMGAIRRQEKYTRLAGRHVFLDPKSGKTWGDDQTYRRGYWERHIKLLKLRYRPPYDTRHTFATMMLMAGRTPSWCAKYLGHSIQMFLGTYTKWLDGEQDDRELGGFESWLKSSAKPADVAA